MESKYYISAYCHIKNGAISVNGIPDFKDDTEAFAPFAKKAYYALKIEHPKFFKMDNLGKLAFIAAEALLKTEYTQEIEENIALVFSNRSASLDTDRKHQASIGNMEAFYPSPAVFVYTLPNICLGEISIRHSLRSENSFFIFDRFNAEHLMLYSNSLLQEKKAEKVLCGWVDFDAEDYEAFLYLVGMEGNIENSIQEINRLYNIL